MSNNVATTIQEQLTSLLSADSKDFLVLMCYNDSTDLKELGAENAPKFIFNRAEVKVPQFMFDSIKSKGLNAKQEWTRWQFAMLVQFLLDHKDNHDKVVIQNCGLLNLYMIEQLVRCRDFEFITELKFVDFSHAWERSIKRIKPEISFDFYVNVEVEEKVNDTKKKGGKKPNFNR